MTMAKTNFQSNHVVAENNVFCFFYLAIFFWQNGDRVITVHSTISQLNAAENKTDETKGVECESSAAVVACSSLYVLHVFFNL